MILAVCQHCLAPLKITFSAAWRQHFMPPKPGDDASRSGCSAGYPELQVCWIYRADSALTRSCRNCEANSVGLAVGFLQLKCSQT